MVDLDQRQNYNIVLKGLCPSRRGCGMEEGSRGERQDT